METFLLRDIVIICGLALAVIFVCHRLQIPSIVGFLLTGVLAGPHGLGLVRQVTEVEHLAEIGVVCLLFTIGLEFSLRSLLKIRVVALLGGTLQVGMTLIAGTMLVKWLGMTLDQSIFFGFLLSLSSTAIVLKIIQQRAEAESPHGRFAIGTLLLQDLAVVPMMLITPILAGKSGSIGVTLSFVALKGVGLFIIIIVAAKWIVPWALYQTARLRGQELFLLGVVLVGLSMTWLTWALGLSLALGAFMAGLVISESEYSHRALGDVLPFRDFFTSFFFVSIGMLLDLRYVFDNAVFLLAVTLSVIFIKFITAGLSATLLRLPLRTAVLAGLALSQIGEFSFVLSDAGTQLGLIQSSVYQLFLGVSVLTMIATPFLVSAGENIAGLVMKLPLPQSIKTGLPASAQIDQAPWPEDHLIIAGFGLNGRHLSHAAAVAKIPRVIIELNPDTIRREKGKGQPIVYGDASQKPVLEHAGIKRARVLVIVISDPAATRRIIHTARRLNPKLFIIARSRFVSEMEPLYELGADEVIPEDYEASVEVLTRVLTKYLVPRDDIERFISRIRADHYRMLRTLAYEPPTMSGLDFHLSDVEISSVRVRSGAPAAGGTMVGLDFRKRYGVTVLAIRRGSALIANPQGEEEIQPDDILVLLGEPGSIADVMPLLHGHDGQS